MRRWLTNVGGMVVVALTVRLSAQSPAPLAFEVASIKEDRSNMTGVYDVDLQWGTGNIGDPVSALGVTEEAALITALREQLGLRLQGKRELREVVLIDAVSPPTPDCQRL